jgi:hypothetical protein
MIPVTAVMSVGKPNVEVSFKVKAHRLRRFIDEGILRRRKAHVELADILM